MIVTSVLSNRRSLPQTPGPEVTPKTRILREIIRLFIRIFPGVPQKRRLIFRNNLHLPATLHG